MSVLAPSLAIISRITVLKCLTYGRHLSAFKFLINTLILNDNAAIE